MTSADVSSQTDPAMAPLRLQNLKLRDFKGFRDATIPLGPLTLLVGTNASGKSNVRDSLRFLHGCAQGFTLTETIDEKWAAGGLLVWRGIRGGAREISWNGSQEFGIGVTLAVSHPDAETIATYDYSIGVALESERRVPRLARESLSLNGKMIFDSHPSKATVGVPQNDPLRLRVRFRRGGRQYPSDRGVLSQMAEDDDLARDERDSARILVKALQGLRFLDLSPDAMREPSAPGHLVLGDRGENLSSVLLQISNDPKRRESLVRWLRALTPLDVADLDFQSDLLGRVLVYLVEAGGRKISAQSASDGTLRFLALAAALLSSESGQIFFFEEIDNGFHPTRLHLLLDVLEQASRTLGCQVIATTHNPQLLAFLSERARQDAVLIYRLERGEQSQAVRILDLPDIQRILASQDLGRLFATGWLEDTVEFLGDEEPPQIDKARAKGGG